MYAVHLLSLYTACWFTVHAKKNHNNYNVRFK